MATCSRSLLVSTPVLRFVKAVALSLNIEAFYTKHVTLAATVQLLIADRVDA